MNFEIKRDLLRKQFDRYLKKVHNNWNYITPEDLKKDLDRDGKQYFLLDVRKREDYIKGHIPGSLNIFWLDLFEQKNYQILPRDKTIVVICYVGHTASQILTMLKLLDFNVVGLKFGIGLTPVEGTPVASWSQFGFPLEHHHDNRGYCIKTSEQIAGANSKFDGFSEDLVELTQKNNNYRRVLYTTPQQQLVLMAIPYLVEIGMESHPDTTQFFQIVSGKALAYVGKSRYELRSGDCLVVPPGANHNVISVSKEGLKLFTTYSPPEHPDKHIQKTK